jgi:hypothetical protein
MTRTLAVPSLDFLFRSGALLVGGVVVLLSLRMGDGSVRPSDPAAIEMAMLKSNPVAVVTQLASRPAPERHLQPASRTVSNQLTAALLGRSEAEVVARLGLPDREGDAEPGKVLRYNRPDCAIEVYLFPEAHGGRLSVLDVLDAGKAQDSCLR